MRLRVLGPLEVTGEDGPVVIGGGQPTTVLAALALDRGAAVSTDRLIDAVWGESPPPSASKLLQIYVSRLRKVLPAEARIVTGPTGYTLDIEPEAVDVVRFERHVADGRAALAAGNPALAAAALSRALALWRGPAYADVRYAEFALAEIERLDRLRELAQLLRADAQLALGQHATVLGDLQGLLAVDPTSEALAARAMLAAYRTSGPAEALAIFDRLGHRLRDELDAQPGPELQILRDRILRRDPGLDSTPGAEAKSAAPALLVAPNRLVGRRRELAELRALLSTPDVRLVSLVGAGGVGKSRLALELAREAGPTFANGVVLVELASLSDPDLVPGTVARAVGVDPGPDAMSGLIAGLADREMLLVIDNVEHLRAAAPAFVRLLAGAPRLVIVVTTRVVLHVSGEHVYPVSPLAEDDAVALFSERVLAQDPTLTLDEASRAIAATICRRVDGLPLAIELAASRVRALGLRGLQERFASRLGELASGPRDLPARQQTLRETLAWSVRLLEPAHADVLAALAVFAGSCSMHAAHVVAGADDDAMINLVDHNLIQAFEQQGERRFRMLETIREYALEHLGDRRDAVESALVAWMVDLVEGLADSIGFSPTPQREALERLDLELDNLRAALRHAATDPDPTAELAIATSTGLYWLARGHLAEGRAIYDGILQRRGLVPTTAGIRIARDAASLAWSTGDLEQTEALGMACLEAAERAGDGVEQFHAHNVLGVLANSQGRHEESLGHLRDAVRLAEAEGELGLAYIAQLNIGNTYLSMGRLDEAKERFATVLDYRRGEGQSIGTGVAQLNLGETEYRSGNLAAAEAQFAAARAAFQAFGERVRIAHALGGLAAVEARTGRPEAAARNLGRAARILRETGWGGDGPDFAVEATAAAREALGDEVYDRLYAEGATSSGT